jgi:hypothetical protein
MCLIQRRIGASGSWLQRTGHRGVAWGWFEWAQENDWLWRVFRVPASVLNRTLGYGPKADD